MKKLDDRLFAFKTLEEAIKVTDDHILNCLCWWTDERSHNHQTRHVWHTWLECAEDFSQLGKWLRRLQYLEEKDKQLRPIILGEESDKDKIDKLFEIITGVERGEVLNEDTTGK